MAKIIIMTLAMAILAFTGCGKAPSTEALIEVEETVEEPEAVEEINEIPVITPIADPGTLTSFRDRTGDVLYITVTGDPMGSVWGTDIYTDDSYLAAAAIHAGVLSHGETDLVMVTLLPGEEIYHGTANFVIESMDYGEWGGSYSVEVIPFEYELAPAPDPGNLTSYRGLDGDSFIFEVRGDTSSIAWGTDIYTDDSYLSAVAIHAGILEQGETGTVVVTILPGEESYTGSTSNGVTSLDYGEWDGSYIVE